LPGWGRKFHHALSCRPGAFHDVPGVENMKT
jgi:hypothetical protein